MGGYGTMGGDRGGGGGTAAQRVGRSLVWKAVAGLALSGGLLVASAVSSSRRSRAPAELETSMGPYEEEWSCGDYDDDVSIRPSECGQVDRAMCWLHCTTSWCASLCGASCVKGEGALCAYQHLADLEGTCRKVSEQMSASGLSVASEIERAVSSEAVRRSACTAMSKPFVTPGDTPPETKMFEPRTKQGYPSCDHHAWCSFCRGSESCEGIVPKAKSRERVESGGCAAATLDRIVSICADAGLLAAPTDRVIKLRKIFYLNCDGAVDRRDLQERHLSSLGVEYERVPCVTGDSIDEVLATPEAQAAGAHLKQIRVAGSNDITRAHTVGTWVSHYALFDRVAKLADVDPEGLYLILEDDALLDPRFSIADVERFALSLPKNWAYASFNVHESYCLEDRVNEDWFLKRAHLNATLYDNNRVFAGDCTPVRKDYEWDHEYILYLSAAAQLLRPSTARVVTDWLDTRPLNHVDAMLRTPSAAHFPSFQFRENLFYVETNVTESRIVVDR